MMSDELRKAAEIAVRVSLKVMPGEQALIVSNPDHEVSVISKAVYDAIVEAGGRPTLIYQPVKSQLDFAEKTVLAAFGAKPEIVISLSAEKMGKDEEGIARPYVHNGAEYDHIFHLQLYGTKTCRSFWSPSTTIESFIRTVPIDYDELRRRCGCIKAVLDRAVSVRVNAPGGTDVFLVCGAALPFPTMGIFPGTGPGGTCPRGKPL